MSETQFFLVETTWGSQLFHDRASGTILHAASSECASDARVFLFVPAEWPGFGFLICEQALAHDGLLFAGAGAVCTALGIDRLSAAPAVGLIHLEHRTFLAATPIDDCSSAGRIEVDRSVAGPWERFHLRPLQHPPQPVLARAAALRPALAEARGPDALVAILGAESPTSWAVSACFEVLSPTERATAAERLLRSPDRLLALGEAFPRDPWANDAIPTLLGWLAGGRRASDVSDIGPDYDFLEHVGQDGRLPTIPARLNSALRRQVEPSRTLAILATARNEGIYLLDWIAYHRMIGAEHIVLYTNDNDDGSDELLDRLASAGEITLVRNSVGPGVLPQYKSYAHALQFLADTLDFRWLAIIDLDEFIRINESVFSNAVELLGSCDALGADTVGLSWRFHGPSAQSRWVDKPIFTRFAKRFSGGDMHLKSVIRPREFVHSQCHYPYDVRGEPRRYVLANGQSAGASPFNEAPTYDRAWISHYYFKSAEEFVARRIRNRGDGPVVREANADMITPGLAEVFIRSLGGADDPVDAPSAALTARVASEKARLLQLPGVAAAEAACGAIYRRQAEVMERVLAADPRFSRLGSFEAQLLQLLAVPSARNDGVAA